MREDYVSLYCLGRPYRRLYRKGGQGGACTVREGHAGVCTVREGDV